MGSIWLCALEGSATVLKAGDFVTHIGLTGNSSSNPNSSECTLVCMQTWLLGCACEDIADVAQLTISVMLTIMA